MTTVPVLQERKMRPGEGHASGEHRNQEAELGREPLNLVTSIQELSTKSLSTGGDHAAVTITSPCIWHMPGVLYIRFFEEWVNRCEMTNHYTLSTLHRQLQLTCSHHSHSCFRCSFFFHITFYTPRSSRTSLQTTGLGVSMAVRKMHFRAALANFRLQVANEECNFFAPDNGVPSKRIL